MFCAQDGCKIHNLQHNVSAVYEHICWFFFSDKQFYLSVHLMQCKNSMGIPWVRFISISFNFQVGVVGPVCFFFKIASRLRGEWASIHSRGLFETPRDVGKKPTFPNVISKWRFEFSLNFAKGIGINCHRNQNWHPFSSPRFLGGKSWRAPWLTMDPCPGAGFSTYELFGCVVENLIFEGFPPMSWTPNWFSMFSFADLWQVTIGGR